MLRDAGDAKTVNDVLNEMMTRVFPELTGIQPELLSKIRNRIDQSISQTGLANITEIFDLLKSELLYFFQYPTTEQLTLKGIVGKPY